MEATLRWAVEIFRNFLFGFLHGALRLGQNFLRIKKNLQGSFILSKRPGRSVVSFYIRNSDRKIKLSDGKTNFILYLGFRLNFATKDQIDLSDTNLSNFVSPKSLSLLSKLTKSFLSRLTMNSSSNCSNLKLNQILFQDLYCTLKWQDLGREFIEGRVYKVLVYKVKTPIFVTKDWLG